jgi:uncharacterized RDD family membrane protein YckC
MSTPSPLSSPPPQTAAFTPAEVPRSKPSHHYGDVGAYIVRRLLALLVDVVAAGGLIALGVDIFLQSSGRAPATSPEVLEALCFVGALWFLYRWSFEGIAGSTLGKLLFGLGVGHKGGGSAGLVRAFFRNLLLPVDLALIGFLLGALTPLRQRIGDLVAGTVVAGSRIGIIAPLLSILIFAVAGAGEYAFGGGIGELKHFASDVRQYAAILEGQPVQPTPGVSPTPSPYA